MTKKQQRKMTIIFLVIGALLVAGIVMTAGSYTQEEDVVTVIRDSVIHDTNKIDLFGLEVNPGLIAGFAVTGILTVFALIVRILVIPRFTLVPGKFQMVLEWLVGYFSGLSETNSPRKNRLLGAYVFAAGFYIFAGTMFELFGIQAVTTSGHSVALPAPLSDVNGAIMMGCTSYLFIVLGGILNNGVGGLGGALKEFSLPISMSFRLFGALVSGAIVTELVYHYMGLSYVLPVIIGVLFTCLHALIQAYVLTMLVALFYGEVSEPSEKKLSKLSAKAQKTKSQTA
ncbi:MAG: F0F1 ATP synthase subunit A [Firmicutes bacterium]|nr:F0F1 ATP synthase subunit A [Bacillota bacterium]MEE3382747.1 F0F1 ATP synthase subunit A [Anaerovoracaceae bacterium]MBQ1430460.1 F0F1 ATP synthase subunit A [Bacillota bacterium]MBQ1690385.1 F0F1 ATP synthase subunit A [Bacillota bacterium]MBQ1715947.1 F0F1 ATP synthase subunit A [Bacillota bacterium]